MPTTRKTKVREGQQVFKWDVSEEYSSFTVGDDVIEVGSDKVIELTKEEAQPLLESKILLRKHVDEAKPSKDTVSKAGMDKPKSTRPVVAHRPSDDKAITKPPVSNPRSLEE